MTRSLVPLYYACDAVAGIPRAAALLGHAMFVCNCNGVRMRDMSVAVDNVMGSGAPSVDAVYQACGVAPKCGRCKVDIQRMLDAANAAQCPLAAE